MEREGKEGGEEGKRWDGEEGLLRFISEESRHQEVTRLGWQDRGVMYMART